ncbi:polyprenyl synthetase family protein, partial [Opitutales bacterium]|nr:polyprenyl synthetase family protein [Opitutales bacterium]
MNLNCNLLSISNDLPYEARSFRFIEFFEAHLSSSLSLLDDDIKSYALQSALAGGKRIRPLLVFHFAGRSDVLDDSTLKASVILEIVHLASLIHDDILDG